MADVVIGVDLGTTSTKAVAFTAQAESVAVARRSYPLSSPHPGYAEQDAEEVVSAGLAALSESAQAAGSDGHRVVAVSFSSAMHGLVGVDGSLAPRTPLAIWADARAARQAERLRADPRGLALHRRTGTPIHPMSPLVKLRWYAEQAAAQAADVRYWCTAKDLLVHRLTGRLVTDFGLASGTGLMDLDSLDWDAEALAYAQVDRDRLPALVDTRESLALDAAAPDVGLSGGLPIVAGGADGPLANLGVGAVRPGAVAVSIGTSGAVRASSEQPRVDEDGRVFCYVLAPGRYVVGGAVNNGGIVLDWLADALAPDLAEQAAAAGTPAAEELLKVAAEAPAGSDGLLFLPYLLGERAPRWTGFPRGCYLGLTREHHRAHLLRAAVEGVSMQLAVVTDTLLAAGIEIREVRATGGFARSALWRRVLACVLGRRVGFAESTEGSALGAALLAWSALGVLPDLDEAAALIEMTEQDEPDADDAAAYARLRPIFEQAAAALDPVFTELLSAGAPTPGASG